MFLRQCMIGEGFRLFYDIFVPVLPAFPLMGFPLQPEKAWGSLKRNRAISGSIRHLQNDPGSSWRIGPLT